MIAADGITEQVKYRQFYQIKIRFYFKLLSEVQLIQILNKKILTNQRF